MFLRIKTKWRVKKPVTERRQAFLLTMLQQRGFTGTTGADNKATSMGGNLSHR